MNKKNVLMLLVALCVGAAGCCLIGGALMFLGYADPAEVIGETPRAEPGETRPAHAEGSILGEWLDSEGPPEFFRRLRAGENYEALGARHTGQAFALSSNGVCFVEQLVGETVGPCVRGSFTRWVDCRWKLEGNELTFTLGEGTRRVLSCKALEETTVAEPGKVDRRRVALNPDGTLTVTIFDPVEIRSTYRRVE